MKRLIKVLLLSIVVSVLGAKLSLAVEIGESKQVACDQIASASDQKQASQASASEIKKEDAKKAAAAK